MTSASAIVLFKLCVCLASGALLMGLGRDTAPNKVPGSQEAAAHESQAQHDALRHLPAHYASWETIIWMAAR